MGVTDADEPVARVFQALCEGRLTRDDLTARKIAAFLGQTTMVLYHHFGSLDGFLIRVDGAGWRRLADLLEARARAGADLRSLAVGYVEFALRHPDLYWLMAERRFDRARLREQGRLRLARPLWGAFVELLRRYGSTRPAEDTHVLFAGLHGIAMLTLSGRANLGEDAASAANLGGVPAGGTNLREAGADLRGPAAGTNLGGPAANLGGPAANLGGPAANPGGPAANPGGPAAAGANLGEDFVGEDFAVGEDLATRDDEVAFAAARRLAELVLPGRPPAPPAPQASHGDLGPRRST
ncbi:TetR/AcrR family transcriptional regulator [Sorangium sp. So ce1389]|uniref:TetR/AcrR family transcriptional regulator n=1 Tax=Sorangium sp. So ce1389 TaxID=3133336 RepID=UPI003F5ED278